MWLLLLEDLGELTETKPSLDLVLLLLRAVLPLLAAREAPNAGST